MILQNVQNAQSFAQRFNEQFQKELEARLFPTEKLSAQWRELANYSLEFTSLIKLGINPEDWRALIAPAVFDKMNLYQFSLLSNNYQDRSPRDLHVTKEDYVDLMAEADEYVKIWQELTDQLRDDVEKRLQEELQMKAANDKGGGFKPVKAEA